MSTPRHTALILAPLLLAGVGVFTTGITWGLPSHDVDRFLFGARPVWTGKEILRLSGGWAADPRRGADVDADALADRSAPVCVNDTDEQRAQIILRYRLYTYQPDEMITMRALAGMKPEAGRFDPRLYQYGGLWIYPVGVLLKVVSQSGFINLSSDVTHYLDRPEEFARFYVVARVYTVFWALVGLWAVFWLTRRFSGGCLTCATVASLAYLVMPVVVNMAHEAKPHLPAAVLMLLTVMTGIRYVETGLTRWWLLTAGLCGAAFGMVLSAWPIFVLLPVMLAMRRRSWGEVIRRTAAGGLMGAGVYLLTNPYIAINLFINREVLISNFGNSLAMYEISRLGEGLLNAAFLIAEGTSTLLAIAGMVGVVMIVPRRHRDHSPRLGWLLAAPAIVLLMQFIALAAGKPGEYGRFAVLPDIALAIAAVLAVRRVHLHWRWAAFAVLVIAPAVPGYTYLAGFVRDSFPETSRVRTAYELDRLKEGGYRRLGVLADPAPYCLPPVDLFQWRILLMPREHEADVLACTDVLVRPWDGPDFVTDDVNPDVPNAENAWRWNRRRITWADKTFALTAAEVPILNEGR